MQRAKRKLDHIKYALALGDGPTTTHLADIRFVHNCLPEISPADINLSCEIFGKQLRLPFFIDAITGGTGEVARINQQLAEVAREVGCGIASGSQYGAVHRGELNDSSYTVLRSVNPEGLVIANVSGQATWEEAQKAIDMIGADALEIHLNVAQELFMAEGDREFSHIPGNIKGIVENASVPVIVKETGCGIAGAQYKILEECGVRYFDCAGAGGTNFIAIEAARTNVEAGEMLGWGHPTCWSLLDAHEKLSCDSVYFASGGIRSGLDMARAFALGARGVSISSPVLKAVMEGGTQAGIAYINSLVQELKTVMVLLNAPTVSQLKKVSLMIMGDTKAYCEYNAYDALKLYRGR